MAEEKVEGDIFRGGQGNTHDIVDVESQQENED